MIIDLVLNHTSDQHPWFLDSAASRTGAHADWYLWRDPGGVDRAGRPLPPNDWVSWFGGPAWTYEPRRGQFYHHTFLAEQPDLDWRQRGVETAQHDVVRAWIARGVDGFRLDVFNVYLKHPDLPSNPTRRGSTAWDRQVHLNDLDQPDLPELLARFRAVVDAAPGRMTVGEMFVGTTAGRRRADDRAAPRLRLGAPDEAVVGVRVRLGDPAPGARVRTRSLADRRPVQPRPAAPGLAPRGDGPGRGPRSRRDRQGRGRPLAHGARDAVPLLRRGDRHGRRRRAARPRASIPPARHASADFHWWDRSQSRTPMPWTAAAGAGFTTGRPWLRFGPDTAVRNVAGEAADEDSVLACYRRLLRVAAMTPSLQDGAIALVRTGRPDVLAYRRGGAGRRSLTLIAFGRAGATVTVPPAGTGLTWRPVVGTHRDLPDADPGSGARRFAGTGRRARGRSPPRR